MCLERELHGTSWGTTGEEPEEKVSRRGIPTASPITVSHTATGRRHHKQGSRLHPEQTANFRAAARPPIPAEKSRKSPLSARLECARSRRPTRSPRSSGPVLRAASQAAPAANHRQVFT